MPARADRQDWIRIISARRAAKKEERSKRKPPDPDHDELRGEYDLTTMMEMGTNLCLPITPQGFFETLGVSAPDH